MKRSPFFARFFLSTFFLAVNSCGGDNLEVEKANIRALVQKANEAVANQDWETFEGVISEDYELFTTKGRQSWKLEVFEDLFEGVSEHKFDIGEISIHISGDATIGWVKYRIHEKYLFEGKPGEFDALVTLVFEKKDSGWRLAHAHRSAPLRSSEGEK